MLIYVLAVRGHGFVTLESDNSLSGVLINGSKPRLFGQTTPGHIVTAAGTVGVGNEAAFRASTLSFADYGALLNPAVLGKEVVVCQTQIYFNGNVPRWCSSAGLDEEYTCSKPFCVDEITRNAVWSWSTDGTRLYKRSPPDASTLAFTATISLMALAVLEAGSTQGRMLPGWVQSDALGWSVFTGIVVGGDWSVCIVHGAAIGASLALRNTGSILPTKALATSMAVTVAMLIPANAVGAGAFSLLQLALAVIIATLSGKRGALWALPWCYQHGLLPLVVQSAALDLREAWVKHVVAALLTGSLTLLGWSATDRRQQTWYDYFRTLARDRATRDAGRGRMVPGGPPGAPSAGAVQ